MRSLDHQGHRITNVRLTARHTTVMQPNPFAMGRILPRLVGPAGVVLSASRESHHRTRYSRAGSLVMNGTSSSRSLALLKPVPPCPPRICCFCSSFGRSDEHTSELPSLMRL